MESENLVLGSMLIAPTVIDDVTDVLTGSDFADARRERIFDTIVALHGDGKPVDAITVADALGDDLARCGGVILLHELVGAVATPASAGYHAGLVKAASMRRTVRSAGIDLQALSDTEGDPLDVVNAARARLDEITDIEVADEPHESAVYSAIDSLARPLGIKTPWPSLDRIISGWSPGMLYVAGARPGIGKTVLGIGAAIDVARRGLTAIIISLEMPKTELYLRMLSSVGSVLTERIQHRSLRGDDDRRMSDAAGHIASLPLVVDDRSALSLAQIRAKVRAVQRTREVGLVVVDYLGLVKPPPDAPRNDRRVQVDAIAQGLKNLARDLGVAVLALAQLNRGIEGRSHPQPTLSDLRESGGIEAAADVVALMHRTPDDPGNLVVVVAKNRHGPQAQIHLDFRGEYARIEDGGRAA